MKHTRTTVTDHALVQYLQLVWGVDMEGLRDRVARITDAAADHDGCTAIKHDGAKFIMRDLTVIDCKPDHRPKLKTNRKLRS